MREGYPALAEENRISLRDYGALVGKTTPGQVGNLRRLAEQGKIPGAARARGGAWTVPEPPGAALERDLAAQGAYVAGFGDRKRSGEWVNVESEIRRVHGKLTKETARLYMRNLDPAKLRGADRVVIAYYDERGRREHKTVVGPLGRISAPTAANRLRRRYGVGLPA